MSVLGPEWREVSYVEYRDDGVPPGRTATVRVGDEDPHYFIRDEPAPVLPTEPGYYVADEPGFGGTVVVELLNRPSGQWVDAGDRNYLDGETVRAMGPLVRLEPRAVTAGAVLEAIRPHLPNLRPDGPVLDEIAREFGVSW